MKDDGGPAFPVPGLQHDEDFNGMTLRDYFAARAMAAMLGNDVIANAIQGDSFAEAVAKLTTLSYLSADAMLEARDK